MERPDGNSYAFTIRETVVDSRTLEEELKKVESKVKRMFGGDGSQPVGIEAQFVKKYAEDLKRRIAASQQG